jgi:potassium-dependent mechanosensitive channel
MDAIIGPVRDWAIWAWAQAQGWLTSPAAWSQFAALLVAWGLAVLITRRLVPVLQRLLTPAADAQSALARARRFALIFLPLTLPLLAFTLMAAAEGAITAAFGRGDVIAFGKRVFLFLAARALVRDVLTDSFLRFLGRYILLPVAGLYALGLLPLITTFLTGFIIQLGNIQFSAMALVRGVIAGALLFWLGMWSNQQTSGFIGRQPLRPALRQLSLKAAEFAIFGVAFLLLMNIMGISLSSLAILGGAVGVGLGFGLQKIASNFISGVILLVEGQMTVGDRVMMNGGETGRIIRMTARSTILETEDGSWVIVPNEDFITTRVTNYSDSGDIHRLEAAFAVAHGTDLAQVTPMALAALARHADILTDPNPPGVELRGFAEAGVRFAAEFWVRGEKDASKHVSDVLFLIWEEARRANVTLVGAGA